MAQVTVLEAAAKTRWATPAAAAALLGLPADSDTLAALGVLLDGQSAAAVRLVGRPIARAHYLERVPGWGTPTLKLSRGPVESVVSITLRGRLVDPAEYYVADPRGARIGRTSDALHGESWELTAPLVGRSERVQMGGDARPDYVVDYWAGYVMPEDDQALAAPPGAALPADLVDAVVEMVRAARSRASRDPGVKVMKKADRSIEFHAVHPEEIQLPGLVLAVLEAEADLL